MGLGVAFLSAVVDTELVHSRAGIADPHGCLLPAWEGGLTHPGMLQVLLADDSRGPEGTAL